MSKVFELHIKFTAEQDKLYREAIALRKQADEIERKLRQEVQTHPDISVATRITNYARRPKLVTSQSGFTCTFAPDLIKDKDAEPEVKPAALVPHTPALPYVEPKVINNLLNSKLLTNEEKRRMIFAAIPNLEAAIEAKKEAQS